MKPNYEYKFIDEKTLKLRKKEVQSLIACKAMEKTSEGYALKLTEPYLIKEKLPGNKFTIRYIHNDDQASIDWDAKTREFFIYIQFKDEDETRFCSLGYYPEFSEMLDVLKRPLCGGWWWRNDDEVITIKRKRKVNNLLGALIGSDVMYTDEYNFAEHLKVLDARVDALVKIVGKRNIYII